MTERHYRSGKMQTCLICRQSEEIRETVKQMGERHELSEIVAWLKTMDVDSSIHQVQYFLRKNGVSPRRTEIKPKNTYMEKVKAYIDELIKLNMSIYTIRTLRMHGSSWTIVTANLHKSGMIEPTGGRGPRTSWKVLASNDELRSWGDHEMQHTQPTSMNY